MEERKMSTDEKELTKEEKEYLKKVGTFCFTPEDLKKFNEGTRSLLHAISIFDEELFHGYGEISQALKKETNVSLRDFISCCYALNKIYHEQVDKTKNDPFK